MSDDGWIPRGFDAPPILMAHWKKQQEDYYYTIAASTFAQRMILPPYIDIFGAAKRLLDAGEFAAAVVVAQTACEVPGENVLVRLMKKRGGRYPLVADPGEHGLRRLAQLVEAFPRLAMDVREPMRLSDAAPQFD